MAKKKVRRKLSLVQQVRLAFLLEFDKKGVVLTDSLIALSEEKSLQSLGLNSADYLDNLEESRHINVFKEGGTPVSVKLTHYGRAQMHYLKKIQQEAKTPRK